MTTYPYTLNATQPRRLGLIVLQADERIEQDFRQILPLNVSLLVSRIPSAQDVSPESLRAMKAHLQSAAALFPADNPLDVLGFACTSGAAEMGPAQVAGQLAGAARAVTDPVTALTEACGALGIHRLALLSPYVEPVSRRLCSVLTRQGIDTVAMGSFDEAHEARVARISPASTRDAAKALAAAAPTAQAIFLSCTNLDTLPCIADLERSLGRPVLSSNLVLAWHMLRSAGLLGSDALPSDCL